MPQTPSSDVCAAITNMGLRPGIAGQKLFVNVQPQDWMPPSLIFLFLLPFCWGFYTEEPPVKLLTVNSVASRFPAADSDYRDSVVNGHVSVVFKVF